ncbi:MAG: alpha/beta hydrolase [Pseudomonadota bacterium]
MPKLHINGFPFEYDVAGPEDGEPVLLVMGFSAQMTNWPDAFRQGIADAGYRVIRFDNRDIGLSHQFDDHAVPSPMDLIGALQAGKDVTSMVPYLLDDMAADAVALLDALDAQPAHIIGASMGGMIVQLMALNHPDFVRSLIPVMTTSGDPSLPPATPEAMVALTAQPASTGRDDVTVTALNARRTIGSAEGVRDSDAEILQKAGEGYDRAYTPMGVGRQYGAILAQPRWHDRLADVKVPTKVLHGEVDPLIPSACGKDIAARIPGATYVGLEGWGHDVPTKMIPTLVDEIVSFLKTVD